MFNCRRSQHVQWITTKFRVVVTFREEERRQDPGSGTWGAISLCICFIYLIISKIWDKHRNTLRRLEHAKKWKQPKCPSTDEWIKMWYVYTMEYYSDIKKEWNNAICSNMGATRDYHTKWNKSERDKYRMISLICGI